MARRKKLQEVYVLEDAAVGVKVPIYYDPNPGRNLHTATYGDQTFEAHDIAVVRSNLAKFIRETATVGWQAVIEVHEYRPFYHTAQPMICFGLSRYHIASLPDGSYRHSEWEGDLVEDEGERLKWSTQFYWDRRTPFAPPCEYEQRHGGDARVRYYPYSEELWRGLTLLHEQVAKLKGRLDKLLDVRGGEWPALAQVGQNALLGLPQGRTGAIGDETPHPPSRAARESGAS